MQGESPMLTGLLFVILGAVCGGSFGLPSKFVRKDTPWEVLWGPFFLFVTVLLPVVLGPLLVKDFWAIYAQAGLAKLLVPLVFGFLWGMGSMTLGMSFAFIGLSLAYALNYGAQIAFGSMAPRLLLHPETILTPGGYVLMAGVAVCLLGVVVSGRAAMLKERSLKPASDAGAARPPKMLIGVAVGIASGILCACYALACDTSADIVTIATTTYGNPSWSASWAQVALILWGGAVSACGYCLFKLTKNRTWGHFTRPGVGRILALAAAMAVLHDGAIFCFNLALIVGSIAVSVAYPVFMSLAIIVGNVHGFRSGEWRGASRQSIAWIVAGIAILVGGVCILGIAMSM
jgi:L-rhamnose-H+ transport protein